jgi:hypothetical protein
MQLCFSVSTFSDNKSTAGEDDALVRQLRQVGSINQVVSVCH